MQLVLIYVLLCSIRFLRGSFETNQIFLKCSPSSAPPISLGFRQNSISLLQATKSPSGRGGYFTIPISAGVDILQFQGRNYCRPLSLLCAGMDILQFQFRQGWIFYNSNSGRSGYFTIPIPVGVDILKFQFRQGWIFYNSNSGRGGYFAIPGEKPPQQLQHLGLPLQLVLFFHICSILHQFQAFSPQICRYRN